MGDPAPPEAAAGPRRLSRRLILFIAAAVAAGVALAAFFLLSSPVLPAAAAPAAVNCTDSDGGSLPAIQGTCRDGGEVEDTCMTSVTLREVNCAGQSCAPLTVDCGTLGMTCANGSCVAPPLPEPPPPEAPKLPDLKVTSINTVVANDTVNDTIVVSVALDAAVMNIGNQPAHVNDLNLTVAGIGSKIIEVPVIEEGKLAFASATFSLPNTTGTYVVNATADWLNEINESNEENNAFWVTFTVT